VSEDDLDAAAAPPPVVDDDPDPYAFYEDEEEAREARRGRGVGKRPVFAPELAEPEDPTRSFQTTYQPSRHEAGWLLESLRGFYELNLITDVLAQVKGGKEANVYRCRAHPAVGVPWLAAKVYRPRAFRNLRNDKMYREGRAILTADGRPVKNSDQRVMRAVGKKTAFGAQVAHTSWLMHEYTTLERLHREGVSVPQPFGAGENALLMAYRGDAVRAAPTLSEVQLEPKEADTLFRDVLRDVTRMLAGGMIHGDLSAYNILYWDGAVMLIDFPQVTDSRGNPNARRIFERDVARVCEYFARQGVACDPAALAADLWERYVGEDDPWLALTEEAW
jgi:RIO kinase 1